MTHHAGLCPLCIDVQWHGCKHPQCPLTTAVPHPAHPLTAGWVPTAPSLVRQRANQPTAPALHPPGENLATESRHGDDKAGPS